MGKTKLYGASDDLIEIDGEISDEVGDYSAATKGTKVSASDGTKGVIIYENGNWLISLDKTGDMFEQIICSVGDDNKHTHIDAKGCSSYSDVLVFKTGLEWVKVGKKKFLK